MNLIEADSHRVIPWGKHYVNNFPGLSAAWDDYPENCLATSVFKNESIYTRCNVYGKFRHLVVLDMGAWGLAAV